MKKIVWIGMLAGCCMFASCGKDDSGGGAVPTPPSLVPLPTQGAVSGVTDVRGESTAESTVKPTAEPTIENTVTPAVTLEGEASGDTTDTVAVLKKEYGFTTIGAAEYGWVSVPGICSEVTDNSAFYVRKDKNMYYSFVRNKMSLADAKGYVFKNVKGQYSDVEIEEMSTSDYGGVLPGYVFLCTVESGDTKLQLVCLCMKNQDGTATILLVTAPADYDLKEEAVMYVSTYIEPTKKFEVAATPTKPADVGDTGDVTTEHDEDDTRLVVGNSVNGYLDLGEGFTFDSDINKFVEKDTKVTVDLHLYYTDIDALVEAEKAWQESEGFSCDVKDVTVGGLKGRRLTVKKGEKYKVFLFFSLKDGITNVVELEGRRADVDPVVTDVCVNYQKPKEILEPSENDYSKYQKMKSVNGVTKIPIGDTVAELEGDWYLVQDEQKEIEELEDGIHITGYVNDDCSLTIISSNADAPLVDHEEDGGMFVFGKQSYVDSAGNQVIESKQYLRLTGLVTLTLNVKLKGTVSVLVYVSATCGDANLWLTRLFGTVKQQ